MLDNPPRPQSIENKHDNQPDVWREAKSNDYSWN